MATPLRVLFGATSKSWGGNEKWAAEAATGLAERGHRVAVFCSHDPVRSELESRGLSTRHVELWGDVNPVGFAALARLFRAERPDAVVLTKQREYWMGGLAAGLAGSPLVVLRMGLRRRLRDDIKRRVAFGRTADLIIVNSQAVRETLLETSWLDPSKVRVLLNCVSLEPVSEREGRTALSELGISPDAPVVCGAGRLTRQKGFDILIRAFAIVREECSSARLLILGGGGQRRALEAVAGELGLEDAVVFAGMRRDVRQIVALADVYALSSRNEGMANTLLEAMSVGAPIVATDVSGTREAVENGAQALIVPPEDTDALARAILSLIRDRDLAASLGRAALERAGAVFRKDRMTGELEAMLLDGVMDARRR